MQPLVPTVLAFGFASPWILAGLVLGAIPIVIHLLDRRQFRETSWAAMRFLLAATQRHARRLRLEQFILLAVRTAIPLLVVLALARPYFEAAGRTVPSGTLRHVVLVIDASFSMGLSNGGTDAFKRAIESAVSVVNAAGPGDLFSLLQIAGVESTVVIGQPTQSRAAVIDTLRRLELTELRGQVPAALALAEQLLESTDEFTSREVVLISDLQRDNWQPQLAADRSRIAELLRTLASSARVICLDMSDDTRENRAVAQFQTVQSQVLVNRPTRLRVRLQNHSGESVEALPVELLVDGRLSEVRQVSCGARSECELEFQQTFSSSGEYLLEVRVPSDGLPVDDRRWLALPVRAELSVLLVDGGRKDQSRNSSVKYVRAALAPASSRAGGSIRPTVISPAELESVGLSEFDCVMLCNVPAFTQRESEMLHTYVSRGGGLIVSVGDQVEPQNYNRLLYREGAGILPARVTERQGLQPDAAGAFRFDVGHYEHPVLRAFRGNPDTGLESALTFEYIRSNPSTALAVTVPLRYAPTGDPAMIAGDFGQGRCVLVTTALDDSWGTWPVLSSSFVPMMHELVQYASSGRGEERNGLVGEPIHRSFLSDVVNVEANMHTPTDQTVPVQPRRDGELLTVNFAATNTSGPYELEVGPPVSSTSRFAVNVDPRESDPTRLTRDALARELFAGSEFVYRGFRQSVSIDEAGASSSRTLLSRKLLWLVVCLLFVEHLMAWRFLYGMAALVILVSASLASWGFAG